MQGRGGLEVDPIAVPEGGEVEVKYDGPASLEFKIDFGEWQKLPIDPKTGKGKIQAPIGGQFILLTDGKGNEAIVEIFSTSSPPDPSPSSDPTAPCDSNDTWLSSLRLEL